MGMEKLIWDNGQNISETDRKTNPQIQRSTRIPGRIRKNTTQLKIRQEDELKTNQKICDRFKEQQLNLTCES